MRRAIQADRADESVAPAEFRSDDIAVCAERFAQRRRRYLEVLFRHHDAWPHPAEELFFCDEQAVGLPQDQKEIEGARAEYDRNTVGEQLPLNGLHLSDVTGLLEGARANDPAAHAHRRPGIEFEGRISRTVIAMEKTDHRNTNRL